MKTSIRNLLIILSSFLLASCGREFKIDEKYFEIVPYEGNEILIFESNKDDRDTMFVEGIENYSTPFGPMEIFPDKHEVYQVKTKRTDPNYDRYLEGKNLIELAAVEGETLIGFDIAMKGSWFYSNRSFSSEQLDSIPNSTLVIGNQTYTDVKVFEATEYAKQFSDRDNFSERFYWSISEGFLGLDREDEQWRLVEKHVP